MDAGARPDGYGDGPSLNVAPLPFLRPEPGRPPPRLAVVDVGTNTVLASIFATDGRGQSALVEDLHFVTGLGRGRTPDGRLQDPGLSRALAALGRVRGRLDVHSVPWPAVRAVTTAAVREAPNGGEFVRRVEDDCGITLEVIDGHEEALLVGVAIRRSFPQWPRVAVLDIGGGSTELVVLDATAAPWSRSVPWGSVKIAEAAASDPERVLSLSEDAARMLLDGAPPLRGAPLVAVAGTATTALQLSRGERVFDPDQLHGAPLGAERCRSLRDALLALDAPGRLALPGLHPLRVDALPAGVALLSAVIEGLGAAEAVVSDRGVRWGLLWTHWPRTRLAANAAPHPT